MTREEHHAHLRELGMGWLVDEVESRPRPHVASARKTTTGVRLAVDLYRAGWHHGAVAEISDAKIGSLVDARTAIGGLLDDLACTSDWTRLHVAIAMLDARFLDGSHAIEYVKDPDPARIGPRQVSVTSDGRLVERWRGLRTGPGRLPRWATGSGWAISADGSAGAWMPSIHDMTAACRLVPLADDDRATSLERR